MSTDDLLISELMAVGRWLEQQAGSELMNPVGTVASADGTAPADTTVETVDVDGWVQLAVSRRHRRTLAAVVALTVAALSVTGLLVVRRWQEPAVTSDQRDDPPGPLYVLPGPGWGVAPSSGDVYSGPTETARVAIVGQPDTAGAYAKLMIVLVSSNRLVGLDGEETPVDLETGPAVVISVPPYVDIVQQRGPLWIAIKTTVDDQAAATERLNHISISPQSDIALDSSAGVSVLDDLSVEREPTFYHADLTIGDETAGDDVIQVSTTSNPSAVLHGAVGATAHPTRIGDVEGWRLTRPSDSERNTLVWMATPRRMVAVEGTAPIDTLLEVAQSLHVVTETAWYDAINP